MDEDIIRVLWWRLVVDGEYDHDEMLSLIDAYLTEEQYARLRSLVEDSPPDQ